MKLLLLSVLLFGLTAAMRFNPPPAPVATAAPDSVASVRAFAQVYKVLMSPRCVNCHPAGEVPLQGDNARPHALLPHRGKEGRGEHALKCVSCHLNVNTPGPAMPPGVAGWHMPPADMRMVFEGKTPHELALQLIDPLQNGHKTRQDLMEHAKDELVIWGWKPGEGRTLPPLSYEEFVKAWNTWLQTGAYAPAETAAR